MFWKKRLPKDDPEKREALKNEVEKEGGLEKNDLPAMILSALIVILPIALIVLIVVCLFCALPMLLH